MRVRRFLDHSMVAAYVAAVAACSAASRHAPEDSGWAQQPQETTRTRPTAVRWPQADRLSCLRVVARHATAHFAEPTDVDVLADVGAPTLRMAESSITRRGP